MIDDETLEKLRNTLLSWRVATAFFIGEIFHNPDFEEWLKELEKGNDSFKPAYVAAQKIKHLMDQDEIAKAAYKISYSLGLYRANKSKNGKSQDYLKESVWIILSWIQKNSNLEEVNRQVIIMCKRLSRRNEAILSEISGLFQELSLTPKGEG